MEKDGNGGAIRRITTVLVSVEQSQHATAGYRLLRDSDFTSNKQTSKTDIKKTSSIWRTVTSLKKWGFSQRRSSDSDRRLMSWGLQRLPSRKTHAWLCYRGLVGSSLSLLLIFKVRELTAKWREQTTTALAPPIRRFTNSTFSDILTDVLLREGKRTLIVKFAPWDSSFLQSCTRDTFGSSFRSCDKILFWSISVERKHYTRFLKTVSQSSKKVDVASDNRTQASLHENNFAYFCS